jgi:hypothetical protein
VSATEEIGRSVVSLLGDGDSARQRDILVVAIAEELGVTPSQMVIDLWMDGAGSTTLEIGVDRT